MPLWGRGDAGMAAGGIHSHHKILRDMKWGPVDV